MLRSKVSGLRFAGRDQTGEPGFLIVSAWTRGFPENEGIATGAEVETGRKHDRRLGKEGTFLFRCAFYPDGQMNGSKRRGLAAEPKIEPCQEIRTSRKQHVLTADQWRNVRNRDADGSFHPRCETKSPSFGAPRWGPVPGLQGQTDHQGTWQLTAWIAGCPVIIKKCSSPLIFPDQIDSKFSITAPSAEQQRPSPSSPEMPRLWRQPPCGPRAVLDVILGD